MRHWRLLLWTVLACAACQTSPEARRETEIRNLRSAGFVSVPGGDYAGDARFANLRPYTLHQVNLRSGSVFFYPDPLNRRALVGGERELANYRQLQPGKVPHFPTPAPPFVR